MRVLCLDVCEMEIRPGVMKEHPEGWVGEVPDEVADAWIKAQTAKKLSPKVELTDEQTAVLAAAADAALPPPVDSAGPDLESASLTELRAMAVGRGLTGAQSMKRAQLIAALR